MVAQFWLNAVSGLATVFGIPSESMLILLSLVIAFGSGLGVAIYMKGKGSIPVMVFFLIWGLEALIGFVDWLVVLLPLIIIAAFMFYINRGGNNGGQ